MRHTKRCKCGLLVYADDGWFVCRHCDILCTKGDGCSNCRLQAVKTT